MPAPLAAGKMKAIALISGGLDSVLAAKIVKDQGISVVGVHVKMPFIKSENYAISSSAEIGIPLVIVRADEEFLQVVRSPKFGYGTAMNPCIDCRIFMLRKARDIAERTGASFIITGEVLDERPMSQHWRALRLTAKEAGLEGFVLRPLSAKLLPKTIPEIEGWIDRKNLLAIRGRSRKMQIALARNLGISLSHVASPAGGCLLTNREFAAKLRDLFAHKSHVSVSDVERLKVGRHFRFKQFKIIVGRNADENNRLLSMKRPSDVVLEVPRIGSPITLLENENLSADIIERAVDADLSSEVDSEVDEVRAAIETAARITARYSDARYMPGVEVIVRYADKKQSFFVKPARDDDIAELRIY